MSETKTHDQDHRVLGAKLFPELKKEILEDKLCFVHLFKLGIEIGLKDRFLNLPEMPSKWAYWWAQKIGDQKQMKQFIKTSKWALCWATYMGDVEDMKPFVTDPYWIDVWNRTFPHTPIGE